MASLTYTLKATDPVLDFTATSFPKEADLGRFSCRVEEEKLTAVPTEHYADPEDAAAALERELQAWESYAELVTGVRFAFSLEMVKVIDLDAPEDERDESGYSTVRSELRVRYNVKNSPEVFPDPPPFRYVETEVISRLKRVLRGQRDGGYPLLGAAYDILTDLVVRYGQGDSRDAAERLNVSHNVLQELSKLSASDDPVRRRALKDNPRGGPLTDDQVGWVSRLLPELVERAARIESNAPPRVGAHERLDLTRLFTRRALEVSVEQGGGLLLVARHQVAVAVERDRDVGVPHVRRERLRVDARGDHQRGEGMPCLV